MSSAITLHTLRSQNSRHQASRRRGRWQKIDRMITQLNENLHTSIEEGFQPHLAAI